MDSHSTHTYSRLILSVQRYYYQHRKLHLPLSRKLLYSLHLLESLQLLTLVFPAEKTLNLPWNYSFCGWLWYILSLFTRPDYLLHQLAVTDELIIAVVAIAIGSKACIEVFIGLTLGRMDKAKFDGWVLTSEKKLSIKAMLLVDFCLEIVLFRCLFVSIAAFLIGQIVIVQTTLVALCCALLLVVYSGQKLINTAFVGSTSWFSNDFEAISSPHAHVQMMLTNLSFILFTSSIDFRTNSTKFAAIQCAIGGFKVIKIVWAVPYHQKPRNIIELLKGLLMLWSGFVLLVAEMNHTGQDSILATVLFLFPFPAVLALLGHIMSKHITSTAKILYPKELFQVEHILREHVSRHETSPQQVDTAFTRAGELFPKSAQLLVWALYYYRNLKDVTFVQVNVSKLMKVKWGVIGYIECYHCVRVMEAWIRSLPEQAEPLTFWEYQECLREIQRKDYIVTKMHSELFSELSCEFPHIQRVLKLARELARHSFQYDTYVQSVIKQHPVCPELLSIYSSFLSVLTNTKQANKYKGLSRRVSDLLKANRNDNSVDLFDADCMILVMSLETATLGTIFWAKNTELLGYDLGEIIGTDHNIVIPLPLKHSHSNMLSRITQFRHHHPVYESRHHLYFAHKAGYMIGAHWKVRLVSLPETGDMCIVAALKERPDSAVIAFLNNNGDTVTAMVSDI